MALQYHKNILKRNLLGKNH